MIRSSSLVSPPTHKAISQQHKQDNSVDDSNGDDVFRGQTMAAGLRYCARTVGRKAGVAQLFGHMSDLLGVESCGGCRQAEDLGGSTVGDSCLGQFAQSEGGLRAIEQ